MHDKRPTIYGGTLGIVLLLVVILPWLLMGCTGTTPTRDPDAGTVAVAEVKTSAWDGFCSVAKPISWSKRDTPETVLEVKQHNHLGAVHCGWPE